jgi:hypothetical protein
VKAALREEVVRGRDAYAVPLWRREATRSLARLLADETA